MMTHCWAESKEDVEYAGNCPDVRVDVDGKYDGTLMRLS